MTTWKLTISVGSLRILEIAVRPSEGSGHDFEIGKIAFNKQLHLSQNKTITHKYNYYTFSSICISHSPRRYRNFQ